MDEGPLERRLQSCSEGPFRRTDFSIGHRGACLQFPEHTRESYLAGARMGAGIMECDVTFTRDRQLVCRHSQCDLHTTTNILAIPELAAKCSQPFTPYDPVSGKAASAQCRTSDITVAEFKRLCGKMDASNPRATAVAEFLGGTASFRTDLYATCGTLLTHAESIELFSGLGLKFTPELKDASVPMPYQGDYTQEKYAQQLIDEYRAAGVNPGQVFAQSFNLDDVLYWLASEPMFALVQLDARKQIVPSDYARAARAAGLDIITWTLERSGFLSQGGGGYYYHQQVGPVIDNDGDMLTVLDVLARKVKIRGIFSDWPATVTYLRQLHGAGVASDRFNRPWPRRRSTP
jgi:glycerophosphoryl diester phosphodiesterase